MQLSAFSQGQNLTKVLRRNILKDLQKNVVSMCVSRSFPYFSWVKKNSKIVGYISYTVVSDRVSAP